MTFCQVMTGLFGAVRQDSRVTLGSLFVCLLHLLVSPLGIGTALFRRCHLNDSHHTIVNDAQM